MEKVEAPRHSHMDKAQGPREEEAETPTWISTPISAFPTESEGTSCWRTAQPALCLALVEGDVFTCFRMAGSPQGTNWSFRYIASLALDRGHSLVTAKAFV